MISFMLNGESVSTDADPTTPLLWVIRDYFQLKGSKFGCGMGLCGACTMHLNGSAVRTCVLPIAAVANQAVVTIEGLMNDGELHPVQQVWIKESVAQCGYCQSGQIMSATALLATNPSPSDTDIDAAMQGNICRCGTYSKVKSAIKLAATNSNELANLSDQSVEFYTPASREVAS